jgi:hypothetical protein
LSILFPSWVSHVLVNVNKISPVLSVMRLHYGTVVVFEFTVFTRFNYDVHLAEILSGVRERTLLTKRPLLVGEASINFLWIEGCRIVSVVDPLRPYYRISRPEPLRFLSSSSSIVLTRLNRSRPTTC